MKLKKKTKRSGIGLASCVGLLGLFAVAMLCPVQNNNADAADEVRQDAATNAMVHVKSVVSVALDSAVNVDVVPKSNLGTSSSTAKVTVSTNNTSGYEIFMKTGDGTSNLNATDKTNTSVIGGVDGAKTLSNFGKTAWGYSLDQTEPTASTTFKAVPGTDTSVKNVSTIDAKGDTYNLTFGVAVDTQLPAGTYSNSVVLSVVANPLTVTNLMQLTYMQDMTADICNNTAVIGTTKQLVDTRDGKEYWVTKLKDGNCWMTQNLDLDITAAGLKAADTDLTHDWTSGYTGNGLTIGTKDAPIKHTVAGVEYSLPSGGAQSADEYVPTATQTTVPAAVSNPSQVTTYSWDFGKWVLGTPTLGANCNDQTNIAECVKVGFVDVSGPEWQPTFQAQAVKEGQEIIYPFGATKGSTVTLPSGATVQAQVLAVGQTYAVDVTTKTYDPHYLIGNYYQFNAATAGSGGAIADANAEASICPKGWKLPTSGSSNNGAGDSFYNLLEKYGVQSSVTGSKDGVNYNIATTPLYFVRSGYIELPIAAGTLRDAGDSAEYWSRVATSKRVDGAAVPSAYYLEFDAGNVYPSRGPYYRWDGFSLRCLARR